MFNIQLNNQSISKVAIKLMIKYNRLDIKLDKMFQKNALVI